MQQGTTTPTPPAAPANLGDVIRQSVNGAIQAAAAELNAELSGLRAERASLQAQLEATTSSSQQAALRSQIAKTEAKIATLQTKIDKLGSRTTIGTTPPFNPNFNMNDVVPTEMIISVVGIIFIGFPLALAFARLLWRRANHPPVSAASQLPVDATRRFDHLEQSVDAIAIEVERISENQRYLTKLLSEPRQVVGVGAGSGEPPKPH